jgi:putative hydrolase of the HAD superfamily
VQQFSLANADALMVGDSPHLDYDAALNAGLMAVLLDRDEQFREGGRRFIRTLDGVLGQ